jgi:NO-binding membrane sensor protein with MHYT domain
MAMNGSYDPLLVGLSVAVAILASFTALNLANRLLVSERTARLWWLTAGAVALGGGIWSMHFVGMLALIMPMPATYDVSSSADTATASGRSWQPGCSPASAWS